MTAHTNAHTNAHDCTRCTHDQHISEFSYRIDHCKTFIDPEAYPFLDAFCFAIQAIPVEEEEEEAELLPPSVNMASRLLAIEARLDALEGKAIPGTAMGQPLSSSPITTTTTTTTVHPGP